MEIILEGGFNTVALASDSSNYLVIQYGWIQYGNVGQQ
jgi:hypothetical protein